MWKTMNKKKGIQLMLQILLLLVLYAIDQITKYFAVINLKDKPAFVIWDGVFELNYLENRGAAFGMLQNQKVMFVIIAVVMLCVIGYVLVKTPMEKKYHALNILLVLISAGAVGNMTDRLRMNYVVDFFYFKLIHFPIFNVADIYVSVSCVLLALLILFYYKESDFTYLSLKKKKE